MKYNGGCHCGAVRFEVEAPDEVTCYRCNCSICTKSGYLHLIVAAEQFQLLSGDHALTEYTFNTRTARHLFCRRCGIKSFYVPRSNPDGFSVNVNCLDQPPARIDIEEFDGQNWERHAPGLAQLSENS